MLKKVLRTRIAEYLLIAGLVLIGAAFRFNNLNWDQGFIFHPDERNIAAAVSRISFFKQLNPQFFAYNGLPIYLYRLIGEILVLITKNKGWVYEWGKINLIGRTVSAIASSLVILLIYQLGKKLFNKKTALWAAGFTSLCVSLIQTSHYGVTESLLSFWAILIVLLSLKLRQKVSFKNLFWVALISGLAMATKTSAITFLIMPVFALISHLKLKGKDWQKTLFKVSVFMLIAFLFFLLVSPYNFISWSKYMESMDYEGGIVSGRLKVVYVLQFLKTLPYFFQIKNLVWQMGPMVAIAGLAGLVGLWKDKFKDKTFLIFLSWPTIYLLIVGSWYAKFMRYLVPVIPFLCLTAAWSFQKWQKKQPQLAKVILTLTLTTTFFWTLAFSHIYSQESTRITASRWLIENMKPGEVFLTEHWDDGLPIPLKGYPNPEGIYQRKVLNIYDADDQKKVDYLANQLYRGDWLILSSRRLWGTIINLPGRYPITSQYYQLLFKEKLGYKLVKEVKIYPFFLGLTIPTNKAEETFQVYDHPHVFIFKNEKKLNKQQLTKLLQAPLAVKKREYFNSLILPAWITVIALLLWTTLNLVSKGLLKTLKKNFLALCQNEKQIAIKEKKIAKKDWLIFLGIFTLGVFLRFYQLNTIPPGLHGDEAQSGIEAIEILNGRKYYPYSAEVYGQTTAYFYLVALFFKLFGISATAIRASSALLGIITLPIFFYLVSRLFSSKLGLISVFFLAISHWHIQLSRVGMMIISAPLFTILGLGFLLLALKTKSLKRFILAGLFCGLGLNGYMSLRLLPIICFLIIFIWFWKEKKPRNEIAFGSFIWLGTTIIVASPLLWYAFNNWPTFAGRTKSIFVFNQLSFRLAVKEIFQNLRESLLMLNLKGGSRPHRNLPGIPMLDLVSSLFFLIGSGIAWFKMERKTLGALIITLLAFLVSTNFSVDGGADPFRSSGMIIPVFILVGFGWLAIQKLTPKIKGVKIWQGFFTGLLLLSLSLNFYIYFIAYPKHPGVFQDFHCVPVEVAKYSNSLSQPHKIYLLSNWFYIDYLSIQFLAPNLQGEDFFTSLGEYFPKDNLLNDKQDVVFIVLPFYNTYLKELEAVYPHGKSEKIYGGPKEKLLFTAFHISQEQL